MRPVSRPKEIGVASVLSPAAASLVALRRSFDRALMSARGGRGVIRAAHGALPVMPMPKTIMKTPATSMTHGRIAVEVEGRADGAQGQADEQVAQQLGGLVGDVGGDRDVQRSLRRS